MSDLDKTAAKIREKLRDSVLLPMEAIPSDFPRLSSGIVALDLRLNGGWPKSCINILYGPPSSCKSLIALKTVAEAQKTCRKCLTQFDAKHKCKCGKVAPCSVLYIDTEESWTNNWVEKIGVTKSGIYIARPESLEEMTDIIKIFIQDESVDLVVVDSLAAIAPKAERESSMEDWTMGLIPRIYSRFYREWSGAKNRPAMLMLNQIRLKIGVVYGNPETLPGGEAQKYISTETVKVQRKAIEMSPDKEDPQPLFETVKFHLEKSKAGPNRREGLFDIAINDYIDAKGVRQIPGMVDNATALVDFGRKLGVFEEKPGKYKFGSKEFSNMDDIKTEINGSFAFRRELRDAVVAKYAAFVPDLSDSKTKKRKGIDDGGELETKD